MTLTATTIDSSSVLMCQLFQNGLGAVVKDAAVTCSRVFFQLSSEEKSLLRRTELAYRKKNEEHFNERYGPLLEKAAEEFEKAHPRLKEQKPKVFFKERERAIFQVSQQLLREEQTKLWPQSVPPNFPLFLRDIQGNFISDRWLECLLCEDKNPEGSSELIKEANANELDYDIFNYSLKDVQKKYGNTRLGKFAELVIEDTRAEAGRLRRSNPSSPGQDLLWLYKTASENHKKLLFIVTLTKCNLALVKLQGGLCEELFTHIPSLRQFTGDSQKFLGCFDSLEHLQGLLTARTPVRNSLKVELPKDFKTEDKRKIRELSEELGRQNKELNEAFLELRYILQAKREEIEKEKGTSTTPSKEKAPKQMESSKARRMPSARSTTQADASASAIGLSPPSPVRALAISPATQAAALLSARGKGSAEPSFEQRTARTATVSTPLDPQAPPSSARKLTNEPAVVVNRRAQLKHTTSFMVRPHVSTKSTKDKVLLAARSPDGVPKVAIPLSPGRQESEEHQKFGELVKKALDSKNSGVLSANTPPDSPGKEDTDFRHEYDELKRIVILYKTVEQFSTIFQRVGKLLPAPSP